MRQKIYLAVVILFTLAVVIFALQNLVSITLTFFTLQMTAPLALFVAVIYVLGALTGGGLYGLVRASYRKARHHPPA